MPGQLDVHQVLGAAPAPLPVELMLAGAEG